MLERMPATLLQRWMAYHMLEPFGQERDDLRIAIGASAIVNHLRPKKAGPVKWQALMPKFRIQGEKASQQSIYNKMAALRKLRPDLVRVKDDGDH